MAKQTLRIALLIFISCLMGCSSLEKQPELQVSSKMEWLRCEINYDLPERTIFAVLTNNGTEMLSILSFWVNARGISDDGEVTQGSRLGNIGVGVSRFGPALVACDGGPQRAFIDKRSGWTSVTDVWLAPGASVRFATRNDPTTVIKGYETIEMWVDVNAYRFELEEGASPYGEREEGYSRRLLPPSVKAISDRITVSFPKITEEGLQ